MLSKEQVDYLYDFCYSEGVIYLDIQTELADHLANAIEKELAGHPDRTFDQALNIVVNSFGDEKFKPLLVQQRLAAQRYCQRIFWSKIEKQLRWPLTWILLAGFIAGIRLLGWHDGRIVYHLCGTVSLIGWSLQGTNYWVTNHWWTTGPPNEVRNTRLMQFTNITLTVMACVDIIGLFRDIGGVTGDPTALVSNLIIIGVSLAAMITIVRANYQEMRRQVQTGKLFLRVDMNKADWVLVLSNFAMFSLRDWFVAKSGSIYLLFPATMSFFYFVVCLAYCRTVRELRSRLKKEYPAAFPTVQHGR